MTTDVLLEELEVLESIYPTELSRTFRLTLSRTIHWRTLKS